MLFLSVKRLHYGFAPVLPLQKYQSYAIALKELLGISLKIWDYVQCAVAYYVQMGGAIHNIKVIQSKQNKTKTPTQWNEVTKTSMRTFCRALKICTKKSYSHEVLALIILRERWNHFVVDKWQRPHRKPLDLFTVCQNLHLYLVPKGYSS